MASYKEFYGSKTISAKTLGKGKIKGKILAVAPETMEGKDKRVTTRLCLTVSGEDKLIPLNATNAKRMGDKFGEDYTKWKGRSVQVSVHPVDMAGSEVDGLLVTPM